MSDIDDSSFFADALREANYRARVDEDIEDAISEEEAIDIYNEIINIFARHNISYRNACNISISLLYAIMTGAAELYEFDNG